MAEASEILTDNAWAAAFAIFTLGALLGFMADALSRRLGCGSAERHRSGVRRTVTAVGFGLFAALYFCWSVAPESFSLFRDSLYKESLNSEGLVTVFARYAVHLTLAFFLLVATLTDFDDYLIPDRLTIPGTLLFLALMTLLPVALPSFQTFRDFGTFPARFGTLPAKSIFTPLSALPFSGGFTLSFPALLLTAFGCWTFWCFALLDRRYYPKLGVRRAAALFCRRLRQSPLTPILAGIWILGTALIVSVLRTGFSENGGISPMTERLVSALIGVAVGMAIVWMVRIVGRLTLGREAMGFGDVVFLGMIGAVVGWQGGVIVFFLAPFAGLLFGLIRALLRSEREIPYGPFLALATVLLLFGWPALWRFVEPVFSDGAALLILFAVGAVALVLLLLMIRGIKRFIFG